MKKIFRYFVAINLLGAATGWALAADQAGDGDAKLKANELARSALAKHLSIDASVVQVLSSESHTWPDSSLGCGQPGTQAAQVITPGFEIVLTSPKGNYRVHTSQTRAVICGAATKWGNVERTKPRGVALPLKNINMMIDAARDDLAKRLRIAAGEIEARNFIEAEWPDSSLGCPVAGEQIRKQPVRGFKLPLSYRGRVYTYHTDLNRVRPCPAIEAE